MMYICVILMVNLFKVIPDSQRIISMRTYTCTVYKDSIVLHIKRYVISVLMCDTLLGVNWPQLQTCGCVLSNKGEAFS